MRFSRQVFLLVTSVKSVVAQERVYGVSIPPKLTYLLPEGYVGNINKHFIDTTTSDASINELLGSARNATFYSYDTEFDFIVGNSPTIRTIYASNATFSYINEAGVWVPELNQLYCTSSGGDSEPYYVLNLDNFTVSPPSTPPPASLISTTGGSYYNKTVYIASFGLKSTGAVPAIHAIDPFTVKTTTVLNSYGGVPFNPIDDLAWVKANTSSGSESCTRPGEDHLFFTILDVSAAGETQFVDSVLPNAIFRYTPSTQSVQAVVSRADLLAPNGIYADPTGQHLYFTDVAATARSGVGSNSSGSQAVYKYDLDADCMPVNKRLFAMPRSGYADGIKVDDYGRVWTAEWNGVVVRDDRGRELGVFNAEQLIDADFYPISNFGLAGDKLVILAGNKISILQLGQNVTTPAGHRSCK
ncbi:putative calcium-dependent phosphotriesterase protein [Phaeoacremonium minimum UCRPA7]|uniref:Putative calcium-dependent phosphotriesterase protein n=1 Tax=Phaeoacremonium minimum (strain UCR-PA7) TaxID=1286976 RepID=R8BLE9_PHAM7|nr:putative calcium-dependent phosphotriesterase protein [Phaeoacremonium minimum UCRPA7]EOO00188.1 putative calcium-dependent phosphotriesterase protein [Phaeoacremonium minimum UCRPA7]